MAIVAPEQFRGQAYPATDLYGLGATLLYVLTHTSPSDLPQNRLKIEFRDQVQLSADFADWLERMLEPMVEERFASATAAIAALTQPQPSPKLARQSTPSLRRQPSGSRIQLRKTRTHLALEIPPVGWRGETLSLGGFALFWNGFIFFWTSMAIASGAPFFFTLFSIPFWAVGIGMASFVAFGLAGRVCLMVDPKTFRLQWRLFGFQHQVQGHTADLEGVELRHHYSQNDRPVRSCALIEGVRTHKFGTMLSSAEKDWVVQEVSAFLHQL